MDLLSKNVQQIYTFLSIPICNFLNYFFFQMGKKQEQNEVSKTT